MRLERRTTKFSSSRRIMRLAPAFILETTAKTNYKCLLNFVQTAYASLVLEPSMKLETFYPKRGIIRWRSVSEILHNHRQFSIDHLQSFKNNT